MVLLPLVQSLTTGSIQEHEGLPSQQPASSSSSGWDSWCGRPPEALSAAYAVLCAVFGEVGDAEWAGAAGVAPQHLQQLLHALIPVLTSVQQQMAQMLQEQPIPPAAQAQLCIWHVRLWSRLLQCPPAASLLLQHHEAQAAAAVGWVTPLAVSGDAAEVPLVLSWSEPSSIRQEAVLVLQVLGRAGDAGEGLPVTYRHLPALVLVQPSLLLMTASIWLLHMLRLHENVPCRQCCEMCWH